ncbi:MAG: MoaD family protein [Caldilineales bacterium]|nr:MoaD family protein [Caldilineales bacterium]MDW8317698.1 ubiquitin-like small modifier protein 1 [Anaerolineae bacterium]
MRVRVFATLRPIVGGATVTTSVQAGQRVRDLIDEMVERWPDLRRELLDDEGRLLSRVHVMINGRGVEFMDGLETVIPPNANITIFPPVGGG